VGKEDSISFLKMHFLANSMALKLSHPLRLRKIIILFLKLKNPSGFEEITSKILKACASLINGPSSHIYNHSLHTGVFPYWP
jgi:hypothetical protein